MKKLVFGLALTCVLPLFAAKDEGGVDKRVDTNDPAAPYHNYEDAMAHEEGYEMAVEWHNAHAARLAATVDEGVLAGSVADEATAAALLAQVKDAYESDATALVQIAAVSQWVMSEEPCWLFFWKPSPAAGRKVWVKALLSRAETSDCTYVKLFCLDQLRWCGCKCPCVVRRVSELAERSGDKAVKDMADIVVRTLR